MELRVGVAVKSLAGHDKGGYFFVVDKEDGYLYLADGKRRKIENPKRKKARHVSFFAKVPPGDKLENGETVINSELRRGIRALNELMNRQV